MKRFDIVLVGFPFSDLSQTKLRPAVVVATPGGSNIVLCQITTKKRSINVHEVHLPRAHCEGDIRFDSNVYVDMIFTLHQKLIRKKLGTVQNAGTQQAISAKLKGLFQ